MDLKKIRKIILLLCLILLSVGGGYYLGKAEVEVSLKEGKPHLWVKNIEPQSPKAIDFSLFWNVWERVSRDFIDKSKIDPQKMFWGAISGMVQSLEDPYTVFLPPQQNKEAKEELGGSFEGIGAQLGMRDKKIIVIAPLSGMPAEKAGLLPGDVILKVDGEEIAGWSLPQAVSKIRGQRGTKVVLTVVHKEEDPFTGEADDSVEIEIVREKIDVPSVEVEILTSPCRAAHLKLTRFGDKTSEEWEKAVTEIDNWQLTSDNFMGVVLDLRNNPGGYLQGAVFVSSEFLESGAIVIQEDAKGRKETFSVNQIGKLTETRLVILINKGSASASEIVAGALKEHDRARIVGQSSFGKGSIQEAQDLPQGAGLHITTSRWLLPSGAWINGEGVEVDVTIEDDLETEADEQLDKAVEVLCEF